MIHMGPISRHVKLNPSGFTGSRLGRRVYRLDTLFGSVGHKVKIHKITPATGQERGDNEIKDYVVFQKPQGQDNRLPPPRTLIMDLTMTHVRFGLSHLQPIGQITHTRRSDGAPDPDGTLKEVVRIKIRHYRNYLNRPDPLACSFVVSSGHFSPSV